MELGLRGRVAVVTGGSMGIGKACVEALAGQGVRVATCARGIESLREVSEEIASKTETEVLAVQADVTKSEDVKRFITAAYQKFGRIDILLNNAANFASGDFAELTDENWWNHFNTKVVGYVRFTREVLPYMRERKWGRVMNVVGSAARGGGGGSAGPTNAALINFTKVLSDEVAHEGITVNAIHPAGQGVLPGARSLVPRKGGWAMRLEEYAKRRGVPVEQARAEAMQRAQEQTGPHAEAEDTGSMVLFLSSDRAAAITGQTLAVRGAGQAGVFY